MGNEFGSRLKVLRVTRGLTVVQISKRVGVSTSTYRDWEYGRKISGHEAFLNLAEILNVSLFELMAGEKIDNKKGGEIFKSMEMIEQLVTKQKENLKSFFENETQTLDLQKKRGGSLSLHQNQGELK